MSPWTAEREQNLQQWFFAGDSLSDIARRLGVQFSRAMVSGKLRRMGLRRSEEERAAAMSRGGRIGRVRQLEGPAPYKRNSTPWTNERDETLARLWKEDGLTTGQIQRNVNAEWGTNFTRNAILGRIHRLGLTEADKPARPAKAAAPKLRYGEGRALEGKPRQRKERKENEVVSLEFRPDQAKARKFTVHRTKGIVIELSGIKPLPVHEGEADPPPEERIGLLKLTGCTCKFPIGDPQAEDFAFCGRAKPAGAGPYCSQHARVAYQPETEAQKKERRRNLSRVAQYARRAS